MVSFLSFAREYEYCCGYVIMRTRTQYHAHDRGKTHTACKEEFRQSLRSHKLLCFFTFQQVYYRYFAVSYTHTRCCRCLCCGGSFLDGLRFSLLVLANRRLRPSKLSLFALPVLIPIAGVPITFRWSDRASVPRLRPVRFFRTS